MLGDHIRALKGGSWLHGIDLGDQRVLYLAEQPGLAPGDRLRRVYRPEFTAGASRVELVVHREPAYPSKAVVARAWSRFMDPSVLAGFDGSEQFACWCKIGRFPEAVRAVGAAEPEAPAKAQAPVKVKVKVNVIAPAKAAPPAKGKPAPAKAKPPAARPKPAAAKPKPAAARLKPAGRKVAKKKRAPRKIARKPAGKPAARKVAKKKARR